MANLTAAEIIDVFLGRAGRVLNSDLVDAAKARQSAPYRVDITVLRDGGHKVSLHVMDDDKLKALAVDLRPFLPWVEDATRVSRVMNAVLRSLTDEEWKQRLLALKREHQRILDSELFQSYWSMPADGWAVGVNDLELAKCVINDALFHETINPRMRHILSNELQQGANHYAVSRLLTDTIIIVSQLHAFIVDADNAGVLSPATR